MTVVSSPRPHTSLLLSRWLLCAPALWLVMLWSEKARSQAVGNKPALAAGAQSSTTNKDVTREALEAPPPFRITGRVVNSLTRSPVARAQITVSPMGARRGNGRFAGHPGGQTASAIADADGRFVVEVPSAGGWSLNAAAHGYRSQAYEEHDGFSTAIILTEASPVHEVAFRLTPGAVIEGYVLDEAGEAVRNAQLTVSLVPPATPGDAHPRRQDRGNQRTDDRGYYKFSGLLSGSYEVRVQAQPWYATSGGNGDRIGEGGLGGAVRVVTGTIGSGNANSASQSSAPDPLDVVYPVVWYPGVTDFTAATPITLRGGETKEADFRMLPMPGFHLRIGGAGPTLTPDSEGRLVGGNTLRNNAYLSQVLPDGSEAADPTPVQMEMNGTMEFSGLAPGTYVVHRQGALESASTATIRIAENSAHTLDASEAIPAIPVTVHIDADADRPSLQITFKDVESGHVSFVQGRRDFGQDGPRRGAPVAETAPSLHKPDAPDRTIDLQPGRYEVVLNGTNDLHLASIETKGATATGRIVTITGGSPTLTLHVASGHADVTGFVRSRGKPLEGAMVLLVPATLGNPSGLDVPRRDQSNTDGSFDITGVLPGAYVLVAIDHGWDVNWTDSATLRRFLTQGMPLDLSAPGDRKETVEAQSP